MPLQEHICTNYLHCCDFKSPSSFNVRFTEVLLNRYLSDNKELFFKFLFWKVLHFDNFLDCFCIKNFTERPKWKLSILGQKTRISLLSIIKQWLKIYRCKSKMSLFKLRVTWNKRRQFLYLKILKMFVYLIVCDCWYFRPEAVFFLGDIFDEGKWCPPDEFKKYRQRYASTERTNENERNFFVKKGIVQEKKRLTNKMDYSE